EFSGIFELLAGHGGHEALFAIGTLSEFELIPIDGYVFLPNAEETANADNNGTDFAVLVEHEVVYFANGFSIVRGGIKNFLTDNFSCQPAIGIDAGVSRTNKRLFRGFRSGH